MKGVGKYLQKEQGRKLHYELRDTQRDAVALRVFSSNHRVKSPSTSAYDLLYGAHDMLGYNDNWDRELHFRNLRALRCTLKRMEEHP